MTFADALRDKQQQIGLWISLSHNYAAEVVAGAGFDWLVVDMEHAPNDLPMVLSQLQAIAGHGGSAIVRPPWNEPVIIKQLLDAGAKGLLFPFVQDADEARAAVAASRYPPEGIRGVAGSTRANNFGRTPDYYKSANDALTLIVQIETRAALAQAVEIGTVEGVSGVFFGPADISADMGLLGQPLHPDVWVEIRKAAKLLIARGVPVGTLVTDPDFARSLLDEGFTFVACGTDVGLLAKGSDALLAHVRGDKT
ncbi:4-hydroxy-2-oxoheptanedioate aldolase [Cognatiyoonia koreensis]|uniref:Hydroxypyruvate/pyruvate aldolase n=1 Tax=Cognatiyoonia koreensis TaxID=364200 RepID=A0A1I0RJX3_9RHOB|nr:HpcH/HpaI aldolase/citrate lyase family protein [Cognatiyoonia koreensis]SEW41083.1 4-hydroxy-2-oxoheptanedioate aldolase [Cognatiyoonia koreensis]